MAMEEKSILKYLKEGNVYLLLIHEVVFSDNFQLIFRVQNYKKNVVCILPNSISIPFSISSLCLLFARDSILAIRNIFSSADNRFKCGWLIGLFCYECERDFFFV